MKKLALVSVLAMVVVSMSACSVAEELDAEDEMELDGEEKVYADDYDEAALAAGKTAQAISEQAVMNHLRAAGFPESEIKPFVCIAWHESQLGKKPTGRNSNGTVDRGLFQINSDHLGKLRGCPSSAAALYDNTTNARCAFAVWQQRGQFWDQGSLRYMGSRIEAQRRGWYGYRAWKATEKRNASGRLGYEKPMYCYKYEIGLVTKYFGRMLKIS